ncbi:MAG: hypothetical protein KJZ74_02540 [Gemmatimonadales bacterium]|nr:hypothetical protein [Gemmatimonadales bacterium]
MTGTVRMPAHAHTPKVRSVACALLLLASGCGGVSRFFASDKPCPDEVVVVVGNRTGETLIVSLVAEHGDIVLGSARPGSSVFSLPQGTTKRARFKSRRAPSAPTPEPRIGELRLDNGGVSYSVQCR